MQESTKKEVLKIIDLVRENGIVTRNEVQSVDHRGFIRAFPQYIEELGFDKDEFETVEPSLPNFVDYTGVVFDPNEYTAQEVINYTIKNVLSNNIDI
ncbi:hypothetical protein CI088_00050 [Enterococcus plantarum]|uniref:Uncharacterized protein n=1 Tax=Enterococcus plantarum TaxID=1077675 RepID=A0A2W3ZEQ1_9ENTE|nr:hypothetical protein [Enterococcus plantarum]PZL78198.1 hypothetical protein CI088_00050 [Enterococcus plantarum]